MKNPKHEVLLIATDDGLVISEMDGLSWRKSLAGVPVTSVIAREGVILAGTNDGVWRSDDLGKSWYASSKGLTDRRIRWLAFHPHVSDLELAGTASEGVFISRDGAATWRPLSETPIVWADALRAGGEVSGIAAAVF